MSNHEPLEELIMTASLATKRSLTAPMGLSQEFGHAAHNEDAHATEGVAVSPPFAAAADAILDRTRTQGDSTSLLERVRQSGGE